MSCRNFFLSLLHTVFPCLDFFSTPVSRSKVAGSSNVIELPSSLIVEILSKLPITSIIQCRSVCKSWYAITKDPYFAKVYLQNPPFTVFVLNVRENRVGDRSFYFVEIGCNGDLIQTPCNPKSLDFSGIRCFEKVKINFVMGKFVGSCNGLLCLVETHYKTFSPKIEFISIINPLLGESMMLPEVEGHGLSDNVVYGYGQSTVSGNCKVIRIITTPRLKVCGRILTVGVDDQWRDFDGFGIPYLCDLGITLNGVLHWIGDKDPPYYDGVSEDEIPYWHTFYRSGVIYAFDIGDEVGRCISLPEELEDQPYGILFAIWDGRLCLARNCGQMEMDIWTMHQYGDADSWTRDIILKDWIPYGKFNHLPITTLRNGNLLFFHLNDRNLLSIDPKTKKGCELEFSVNGAYDNKCFSMFGYVPNFLSLKDIFTSV